MDGLPSYENFLIYVLQIVIYVMFCLMSKYYSSSLFSRLLSCLIYLVYNYLLIMLTTYVCSDLNTFYEILSGHVSTYAGTRALERRNEDSRH